MASLQERERERENRQLGVGAVPDSGQGSRGGEHGRERKNPPLQVGGGAEPRRPLSLEAMQGSESTISMMMFSGCLEEWFVMFWDVLGVFQGCLKEVSMFYVLLLQTRKAW